MTRHDFILKWLFYGLGLLPVWWLEVFVLNRFPLLGVTPLLLPLCAVAVAAMENPAAGAGFGLAVGVLCDAVYFGTRGTMTIGLTLIGWATGAAITYVLDQNFFGCLLCAAGGLTAIEAGRVFLRAFIGMASLPELLAVAVPELLWSLVFLLAVYPWFYFVRGRVQKMLRS